MEECLRAQEPAEVVDFLDREFDGRPGLAREFPHLLGDEARAHCLVLRSAGAIVAHAAWRPLRLRSRGRHLDAAGIGLVTTAAARRGRGLASRLVEACCREAEAAGAELALLFGRADGLYRKLGFAPAGCEGVLAVPAADESDDSKGQRPAAAEDAAALCALLDAHPLGVGRSPAEMRERLAIPRVRARVLEDGGRIRAYCVEGKGRDLRGVIHEWGGDPEGVAALARQIARERAEEPTWLIGPEALPAPLPGPRARGPVALFRGLGPARERDVARWLGGPEHPGELPVYVWGLDSL